MNQRLIIEVLAFEYGKSFGFQEYVLNLLDYLYKHRFDILFEKVIIVCLKNQKIYFEKYEDRIQIKTYNCHTILGRLLMQTLMPLNLSLKKHDLVLYTANYSSLLKRCRHILVIHDLIFKRRNIFPYNLMRYQREAYLPISTKLADKIIAISKFTASDIMHYYPNSDGKISVVYNYFNFEKYPSIAYGSERRDCFISVCSMAFHKNTITVLEAFEQYCLRGGTYDLLLVGALRKGTNLYERFEKMDTHVKSKVHIYEKITNSLLAELYQTSKVYVSASLFEGLGMPIVEAMYFGLPVILSDYPVFHEVSMEKGLYFNPLNRDELVDKMFVAQSVKNVDSNYSEDIMNTYSAENTSKKYIDIFNSFYIIK